jgi:hypothetical protein
MSDDEQASSHYRFAREVSAAAPKPGHDLATASFQLDGDAYVLHVVEGPSADTVGFLGISTNFERTRQVRFALHGSLIERLDDLPRSHTQPLVTHRVLPTEEREAQAQAYSPVVEQATTVFGSLRAANGVDPESALVAYDLPGGRRVVAAITGYHRGWYWDLVIVVVGLAIALLVAGRRTGEPVQVTVEQELAGSVHEVSGSVGVRESLSG